MAYVSIAEIIGNGQATFSQVSSRTDSGANYSTTYGTFLFEAEADTGWTFTRWERRSTVTTQSNSGTSSSTSDWQLVSTNATFEQLLTCESSTNYAGIWGSSHTVYAWEFRAVFTASTNNATVTVNASPSNGGTVTGGGQYAVGSTCTVTATPANGYTFLRWELSSGGTSKSASYSFTVGGNMTATAYFKQSSGQLLHGAGGTLLFGASGELLFDG